MQSRRLLWIALAVIVMAGCQTSRRRFNLVPRRVSIITEPSGTKVEQMTPFECPSGDLGVSPIEDRTVAVMTNFRGKDVPLSLAKSFVEYNGNLGVRIAKEGYKTYVGILRTQPDELTVHKIVLERKSEPAKETR